MLRKSSSKLHCEKISQLICIDLFRKTPGLKSLFTKIAGLRTATLLKKTPTQVFSCEQGLHYVVLQYWGKLLNSFVMEIPTI